MLAFIGAQFVFRSALENGLPALAPKTRFIVMGVMRAALVERSHLISKPVHASLLVGPDTAPAEALRRYSIDLVATVPAYVVTFAVIWFFINRYRYGLWPYIVTMGLGQALGDGGIFFFAEAPQILVFLPFLMTNYHAVSVIPFLAVRGTLPAARKTGGRSWLAVPALIGTYLVCGVLIKLAGRAVGLGPG